ncbi:MAG: hypothetical protein PHH58_05440 [Rhodoferax sp.]|nr:hypothetical protein [Rhodoferax sp.]
MLNPFAVILRYEEISYVSMSLATMVALVDGVWLADVVEQADWVIAPDL